jgi:hypothetical protein
MMGDERIGKLAAEAMTALDGSREVQELPAGLSWGRVQAFEGWSARRARLARQVLGLRLAERGGSVAGDVKPGRYE